MCAHSDMLSAWEGAVMVMGGYQHGHAATYHGFILKRVLTISDHSQSQGGHALSQMQ